MKLKINKMLSKLNKVNSQLSEITNYQSVSAASNTYTLDLSKNFNFAIETLDTNAKAVAFLNVPSTANIILTIAVKIKFTNNATITFPGGTVWKDGVTPIFTAGKQYLVMFVSYDNGVSWLASYTGAW